MTDVVIDRADARPVAYAALPTSLTSPPPDTEDPARQVGDLFRRLASARETFGETAFARIVRSVLVALGRAVLIEAETQAMRLAERVAPPGPGMRVTSTAPRRVDFDGWDPGDPE